MNDQNNSAAPVSASDNAEAKQVMFTCFEGDKHPLKDKNTLFIEHSKVGVSPGWPEELRRLVAQGLQLKDSQTKHVKTGMPLAPAHVQTLSKLVKEYRELKIVSRVQARDKVKHWDKPKVGGDVEDRRNGFLLTFPSEGHSGGQCLRGGERGMAAKYLSAAGLRYEYMTGIAYSPQTEELLAVLPVWRSEDPSGEVIGEISPHWLRLKIFLATQEYAKMLYGIKLDQQRAEMILDTELWKIVQWKFSKEFVLEKCLELPVPSNAAECVCCGMDVASVQVGDRKIRELENGARICSGCTAELDPEKTLFNLASAKAASNLRNHFRGQTMGKIVVIKAVSEGAPQITGNILDQGAADAADEEMSEE